MHSSVKLVGTTLQFSDKVNLLGVELDQALTMDRHVSSIVSFCNFHMRALRHIRPRLTLDAAKSVAVSIVHVRISITVTVCSLVRRSATSTVYSVSGTRSLVW